MTASREDTLNLLRKLRMDLTNAQGKLTDAIEAVAALPDTDFALAKTCPECGSTMPRGLSVDEHIHQSHGGPVPQAWLDAERAAGLHE